MAKKLTKIEQLDQQFPGLAAKVMIWFDCGVVIHEVVERLRAEYQVSVPWSTVRNFRVCRWTPEVAARKADYARRAAALEICRELELRDCPEAPTAPLQRIVRLLLRHEACGRIKRALDRMYSEGRLPRMPSLKREADLTGVE